MTSTERVLRNVLRANAAFSIFSAAVTAVAATPLATSLAIPVAELYRLSLSLALFAAFLIVLGTRPRMQKTWILRSVLFVATADVLWVVGTIGGLVVGFENASGLARGLVTIVGLVVGTFGALELRGWREVRRDMGDTSGAKQSRAAAV